MGQLPASRTAVRVALQRAVHQVLDDEPRVFNDPVAVGLFPEATEAAIRGQADQFLEPSWRRIRANFLLRSRQAEDSLSICPRKQSKELSVLSLHGREAARLCLSTSRATGRPLTRLLGRPWKMRPQEQHPVGSPGCRDFHLKQWAVCS